MRVNLVSVAMETPIVFDRRKCVQAPAQAYEMIVAAMPNLTTSPQEMFIVFHLTSRYQYISHQIVGMGTSTETTVDPASVMRGTLLRAAPAILCAHNHPSGDPTPSEADKNITKRLKATCEIMNVEFLDHIVIAGNEFVSIKEMES